MRIEKMDRFFECIASLMSNLLRSCVKNSLDDLTAFVSEYIDGNDYAGEYDLFSGLALPTRVVPVNLFLVSHSVLSISLIHFRTLLP